MNTQQEHHENQEGQKRMGRRTLMRWFMGIGAVSSLAALGSVVATIRPTEEELGANQIEAGDPLVFALGGNKGEPLVRHSVLPGQAVLAFPEGKEDQNNLLIVLHLEPADLVEPTRLDWAPEGFVAYSAICTHLGCTVNYSHEPMAGAEFPHIHCPCHAGIFNPETGGSVAGGPPPRALPQLPLGISEEGALIAAGPFEEPVGVI